MQKKKPKFARENAHRKVRVKSKGWRTPRGTDSKQRRGKKHQPKVPKIGYCTGRKPIEILVANVNELTKLKEGDKVKIRATVGKKKRINIIAKADKMKIEILNK
jgi:ribosomal protein L32E